MPKRIAYRPKQGRRRTFIRQWREHRGLTQEQLADRLETSVASISRLESGTQPYTQDVLEALSEALGADPASLLMRNPNDPEAIWSIWDQAKKGERELIEQLARSVVKTGTKG
jgi:transcriptional regulator with XRE-family HTH domain